MSKLDKLKKLTAKKSQEEPISRDEKKQIVTGEKPETQAQSDIKTKAESQPDINTKLKQETEVNAEINVDNDSQSFLHAKTQSQTIADSQTKTNEESDPATLLLSRVEDGKKKRRMEDERIRRTYWLSKDDIKMIDELAKMTGLDKYEVVALSVQSMYKQAMEKKKK